MIPEEGGGFSVFVPGLPGCMTQGETEDKAISNIVELIPEFIEIQNREAAKDLPFLKEIAIGLDRVWDYW